MASRLVARGKESYDADQALQLAAEAITHRIGEAVARLPEDFLANHPDLEWRNMKGMRKAHVRRPRAGAERPGGQLPDVRSYVRDIQPTNRRRHHERRRMNESLTTPDHRARLNFAAKRASSCAR